MVSTDLIIVHRNNGQFWAGAGYWAPKLEQAKTYSKRLVVCSVIAGINRRAGSPVAQYCTVEDIRIEQQIAAELAAQAKDQ